MAIQTFNAITNEQWVTILFVSIVVGIGFQVGATAVVLVVDNLFRRRLQPSQAIANFSAPEKD